MPAWGMHLATAKRIQEEIKIEKDSFLLGNILPDVNNGYLIKDISCLKTYKETHYFIIQDIDGQKELLPDIKTFLEKNKENIQNPIVLGYFVHLLTDYYWNKLTYLQHGILNKEKERIGIRKNTGEIFLCDREEARKLKVNDFDLFSQKLYKENKIENPKIEEEQLKQIEKIKTVSITQKDLEKIKKYLITEYKEEKQEKIVEKYQIYTEEEMKMQFENSILFILQSIQKI